MATIKTDLVQQSPSGAKQAQVVIAVNADGTPISGGVGSGGGTVEVSNFPASQAVTGPLTNTQFTAVMGGRQCGYVGWCSSKCYIDCYP